MRILFWLLAASILVSSVTRSWAQPTASAQLDRAYQLQKEGRPKAVIELLAPLVKPGAPVLASSEAGTVWSLLGSSYQELETYDQAIRCYNSAIMNLSSAASNRAQYASALENLATVESSLGQHTSSKALSERALEVYTSLGNREGIAATATDLAITEFAQNHVRSAHAFLDQAKQEARTVTLRGDDLAALANVEGLLQDHDRQYKQAIFSFQVAIDLLTSEHGADYLPLAAAYALRANTEAKIRSFDDAIRDQGHAILIVGASIGTNTTAYLRAEIAMAKILRSSGAKVQAARIEKQAVSSLADLQRAQCAGCTVNIAGLH